MIFPPMLSPGLFEQGAETPEAAAPERDFELLEGFLEAAEADRLMQQLLVEARWRREFLQMFGRQIRSPRRVCWYGDPGVGYVYSGEQHRAYGWLKPLVPLREILAERLEVPFNFVLLNHYRDRNDSMGWHADSEPELGDQPVIASLSLGAARTFRVRTARKTAGVRRLSRAIELPHGSLLIMRGRSQSDFQHALPKSARSCGPRLNLTFRHVRSSVRAAQQTIPESM